MSSTLSQKEKSLLQDQLNHEKVCIQKYQKYASEASDPQLKQMFQNYAQQEQQHYSTISQMLDGQVTSMSQAQQYQSAQQSQQGQSTQQRQQGQSQQDQSAQQRQQDQSAQQRQQGQSAQQGMQSSINLQGATSRKDAAICNDMLMTEKYVSGAYDTAIFEFTNANIRQQLNHIQKEEQQHGEGIFNYMQNSGMYNIQD